MIVTLNPGESLTVQFHESDGEFEIHFDTKAHPNALVVKETAGLAGSVKGAALEIMHHEEFGGLREDYGIASHEDVKRTEHAPNVVRSPHEGFFIDDHGMAQSTQLVRCQVKADDGLFDDDCVVLTLDSEGFVTGEFTFYKTMDALEAALGQRVSQIVIGIEAPTNDAVPYGYFLDGHNRIHHTSSVQCRVIPNDLDPEEYVVQLLGVNNEIMGIYELYQTRDEIEAAQSAK